MTAGASAGVAAAPAGSAYARASYFVSAALGFVAGQMFNYVMIVFTRAVSGSDGFTGIVYFATCLVPLALSAVAGPIVDRYQRRSLLLLAQGLWLLGALGLALLEAGAQPGHVPRWILFATGISNGVAFTVLMPVRFALAGDLAGRGREGSAALVMNILLIIGFGLGPVLVGHTRVHLSWPQVLGVVVALFAASQIVLLTVRAPARSTAGGSGGLSWRATRELLGADPVLWQVLIATAISYLPLGPIQLLVPQYGKAVLGLGEAGRGNLMAMVAIGLFAGGALALPAYRSRHRRRIVLATGVVVGAFLAFLPVIRTTSWVSGVLLVCGALGSLGAGLGSAELQGRLPADMRGRVLSLYGLVILVVPAAGAALAGRASVAVGSAAAMQVAGAIVTTAAVLAALALRTLRATVEIAGQRSQQPLVVEEARAGQ